MSGRGGRSLSSSGGGGGRGRGGRGKGGGRGRGRSGGRGKSSSDKKNGRNNNNNNNNNNTASNSNNRQPKKLQAPSNLLKNGDKGADVHVVPEQVRIHFTELLLQFRENPDETILELPPTLTNTERKFLHQLAPQLGLKSKSTGKGENRRIAVSKRAETKKKTGDEELSIPSSCKPRFGRGIAGVIWFCGLSILHNSRRQFPIAQQRLTYVEIRCGSFHYVALLRLPLAWLTVIEN